MTDTVESTEEFWKRRCIKLESRLQEKDAQLKEAKERINIAECLIEKIYMQIDSPVVDGALYTINPSFQQTKCLSGFINDATNKELINKMNIHGWYVQKKQYNREG